MKNKTQSIFRAVITIMVSVFTLMACSGSDDDFSEAVYANDLDIIAIEVTAETDVSIVQVGATEQLTAKAIDRKGKKTNITSKVSWSSADSDIANVNSKGEVKGKANGLVEITAELAGIEGSLDLRSSDLELTAIEVSLEEVSGVDISEDIGICMSGQKLLATGTYGETESYTEVLSNELLNWRTTIDNIAVVSSSGVLTTFEEGEVDIRAISQDDSEMTGALTIDVKAALLTAITVTPENEDMTVGDDQQFKATGSYSGSYKTSFDITDTVVWLVDDDDDDILTVNNVNSKGLAEGESEGTATLTATCGGESSEVTVTVRAPVIIDNLRISNDDDDHSDIEHDLSDGLTLDLKAELFTDSGATDADVTDGAEWEIVEVSDSTPDIATIDNEDDKGKVTFKVSTAGTVVIYVSYTDDDDDFFEDTIRIEVSP